MENFKLLDISLSSILKDYSNLIVDKKKYDRWPVKPHLVIQDDIFDLFSKWGTPKILIAQLPVNSGGMLHSDRDQINLNNHHHNPAINMLLSGTHIMNWYEMDIPGEIALMGKTAGTIVIPGVTHSTTLWRNELGRVIDTWTTGDVAAVRTDVPHKVFNTGNTPRTTLSIRWYEYEISWEEFLDWAINDLTPAIKKIRNLT